MINKKVIIATLAALLVVVGGVFCFSSKISDTHAQQAQSSDAVPAEVTAEPAPITLTEKLTDTEKIPVAEVIDVGDGSVYLNKYQSDCTVQQLVLVRQSPGSISEATLYLLDKTQYNQWYKVLECHAYIGQNGLDKTREGDRKTPRGDFSLSHAMGIKDNPGAVMPYTVITDTMYVCGDPEYYNQVIDTAYVNHQCGSNSEHLIQYVPQYNYTLYVDYNPENEYGKGSAIMLHCMGSYPYTMGCIAISEENMIKVLQILCNGARICIY